MKDHQGKVSLREIAEKTGVTRMAVSLALRGKPGVSEDTRQKVMEVARELGYEPDPEVAKLMTRIRSRKSSETRACLGLLVSGASPEDWKKSITERKFIEGARARAKEYGYAVEHFWIHEPRVSPARLSSIMWNRGIEGVIIAPLQGKLSGRDARSVKLDYNLFSVVEISETVDWPDLDRSIHDQYTAMQRCLLELTALGYSKIGFVVEEALSLRVNGKWTAAYLFYRHTYGSRTVLPPMVMKEKDQKVFDKWYEKNRPDVIISVDRFALSMLEKRGTDIPGEVGYASLDLDGIGPDHAHISGIDQNSHQVGAAAVDMVVGAIHRGQKGIPQIPRRTEIEGVWKPGRSTPPVTGKNE